jgi:hypothetical protein
MPSLTFSLGRNKYDNKPTQLNALDFDDFISQISNTGSREKGEFYVCSALSSDVHDDRSKYPGLGNWRLKRLAQNRRFLALDADYFATQADFVAFRDLVSQWNAFVYTTASHTAQAPRARAIIELDRDVDNDEGIAIGCAVQRLVESAIGLANIKLDPSVYQASQPVYTPLRSAQQFTTKGAALAVDATLAAWPAPQIPSILGFSQVSHLPRAGLSPVMQALLAVPETPVEIAKVQTALTKISADCSYSVWINVLFALRSTNWICAESLGRNWSMTAPHRYDSAAFDNVWQHAKAHGGIHIGTLFHYAKQSGIRVGLQIPHAPAALAALADASYAAGKLTILQVPPPPRDYIFGGVVVAGTVAVMAGVGGTAKTTMAIQIALNGALGYKLGAMEIGCFSSMLLLAEESVAERDRRIGALCSKMTPIDRNRVEKLVYCEADAGQDLRLTLLQDGNVYETLQVDRIIQTALVHQSKTQTRLGLIVIDHARLVMAGDPIASDHVTSLLRCLTRIATETGAAVLLLAHSPKSTYGKDGDADPSEVFGSGAFVDHTRAAFVLHTMRENEAKRFGLSDADRKQHVCMSVVKANYGPQGGNWWFKKDFIQNWHAVELTPVFLLPKSKAATHSSLTRKIIDIVKGKPGQLTSRAIRDRYSRIDGQLGASERDVRNALQRALEEGVLVQRAPTDQERKLYRLSPNMREVLDLPECSVD